MRFAGALFLVLLTAAPARGAPAAIVVLRNPGEAPDGKLQEIAKELGQRCPARQLSFPALSPQLPRFLRPGEGASPLPLALGDAPGEFFRSEDWLGSAVQFHKAAGELEREPAALLSQPERRLRLRDAYLYAARALLLAGRGEEARAILGRAALRLSDLPAPSAAHWGPALSSAAEEALHKLPAPAYPLLIAGPPGWAAHIDEQPLGALPQRETLLRPGPHAVVAVGQDGTRASWLLDLAGPPSTALRLLVDARLGEVCAAGELVGLCAKEPQGGGAALAALLGVDLLVLARRDAAILGWRIRPGYAAAAARRTALDGEGAVAALARELCGAAPALADLPAGLELRARPAPFRQRPARWPAALLGGAGVALALSAVPLLLQQGNCVDDDCTRVYDYRALTPALVGVGAALSAGGMIWLIVSLRR